LLRSNQTSGDVHTPATFTFLSSGERERERERERELVKKLNTNSWTLRTVMCEGKFIFVTTLRPTTTESELVYDLSLQSSRFMLVPLVMLYVSKEKPNTFYPNYNAQIIFSLLTCFLYLFYKLL
jgi:hypothetical protein